MIGTKPYRNPQSERNEIEEIIDRYLKLNDLKVYYVLASQDGVSRAKLLEVTMHEDILAPMAAALYGAARTAHREINKSAPKYVRLESEDTIGLIVPVGKNYVLLVSGKPGEQGLESKINEILEIAREVATKV